MSYIGVGKRLVAILVDAVVSLAWTIPLMERGVERSGSGVVFGLYVQVNGRYSQIVGVRFLIYCLIWFAYFIVMEATLGATVGKLVTGIRVVRPDGTAIGWSESFVRNAFRIVDGFPYPLYLVGAIVIWSDGSEKRRVGDRVGDTRVVTKDSGGAAWSPPPSTTEGPPPGGIPTLPPPPPAS